MKKVKHLTLCFVHDDKKVLLAMKKRGFGEGWWNGYGGKLEPGETPLQGAIRELEEESGIKASKIEKRGFLVFEGEDEADFHTHIYSVIHHSGTPEETEEMRPKWFAHEEIPYDSMWPDDKYWMPLFLQNKLFEGKFRIINNTIEDFELKEVETIYDK
jgi:8-oxo-dGTP pyrophosphatase MutT (NUDIX family)